MKRKKRTQMMMTKMMKMKGAEKRVKVMRKMRVKTMKMVVKMMKMVVKMMKTVTLTYSLMKAVRMMRIRSVMKRRLMLK